MKSKDKIEKEYSLIRKNISKNNLNLKSYLNIHNFKAQINVELDENKIKKVTNKAFNLAKQNKTEEAIEELCKLIGVAVPIASTMLHFAFPDKYAIMDVYCWNAVRKIDKNLPKHYGFGKRAIKNYSKYMKIIRDVAKKQNKSLREIESKWFYQGRNKK